MKIKIECEIEVDYSFIPDCDEEMEWFKGLLDNEEGMTNVRLWSNEVGDEIGMTSEFKYKIK